MDSLANPALPTFLVAALFFFLGFVIAVFKKWPWNKGGDPPLRRVAEIGVGLATGALITAGFYWAGIVVAGQQEQQSFFGTVSSSPDLRGLDARHYKEDFQGIWLTAKNLDGANFELANLEEASLRDTSLNGAILIGANLKDASLVGADLFEADLTDANLRGSSLEGATFEETHMPEASSLTGATVNSRTCFSSFFLQKVRRGDVKLIPQAETASMDWMGHLCDDRDDDGR